MDILVLSPYGDLLEDTIQAGGDHAILRDADLPFERWPLGAGWIISFGYRKIIPERIINQYKGRIINIHISLLPWNKGADPNFWSWFDDTPKGVSIHRIDKGIDTGELLAQHRVWNEFFRPQKTLGSTYHDLIISAGGLFKRKWPEIKNDKLPEWKDRWADSALMRAKGSYHKSEEMEKITKHINNIFDWNIPVSDIEKLGLIYRGA